MIDRLSRVKDALSTLDITSVSSDSFQDKLVVQKIVYLLQMKGLRIGYRFSLYVRGPYSPDLTIDIYGRAAELADIKPSGTLSQEELALVQRFGEMVELKPSQLEVAATYAYFAFERGQDVATATINVRSMKGFYPETQIALGVSRAKQLLYVPSRRELEQLRKEAEPWEMASDSNGWHEDG